MAGWDALRDVLVRVVRVLRGTSPDATPPRAGHAATPIPEAASATFAPTTDDAGGLPPSLRAQLAKCTCCGVCDARYDAFDRLDRGAVRSIAALVRDSARRRDPRAREAARWRAVARGDLATLELACPVAVPFRAVAATFAEADGAGTSASARTPAAVHDPG